MQLTLHTTRRTPHGDSFALGASNACLLLTETPPTFGRSLRFFHIVHEKLFAYPIPVLFSLFVATIYLFSKQRHLQYLGAHHTIPPPVYYKENRLPNRLPVAPLVPTIYQDLLG